MLTWNPLNGIRFLNTGVLKQIFILALGLAISACENNTEEIVALSKPDLAPVESIEKLETIYSDSGIVKVKVTAPLLNKFLQPKAITELPEGINIDFYDNNFNVVSKLTANYAINYEQERKWIARDDVVVINEKNEKLNTEELHWDEQSGKLNSDKFVKITTPEEVIMGHGFEADQNFSNYKIFKVTGTITVKQ